jgi:hypothetical protein
MDEILILRAIGTQECSFLEFLRGLGSECPDRGDKQAFYQLFRQLDQLETEGDVTISRFGRNIEGMILTEQGVARVRAK